MGQPRYSSAPRARATGGQGTSPAVSGAVEAARRREGGALLIAATLALGSCVNQASPNPPQADASCRRVVHAEVVALEQAYVLNRHAAFVPAGMLYALRHDVVPMDASRPLGPGNAMLRPDKRPRPLVLRVNEGDCLQVAFENLLDPQWQEEGATPREMGGRLPAHAEASAGAPTSRELVRAQHISLDRPRTRTASFHITGLELAPMHARDCPLNVACGGDGSNVGLPEQRGLVFNASTPAAVRADFLGSLAKPGQKVITRWRAPKEGTYFAYSSAAPVGGEGDGGQIGLGLFAAVNVEPEGSRWYRSQVSHDDLQRATRAAPAGRHAYRHIDYEARHETGARRPILNMLDGDRIVHSDVNAIIVLPEGAGRGTDAPACKDPARNIFGGGCGQSFREFTVVLHDQIHARQAFAELEDPGHPLHYLKDGMGINYGASGMGSAVLSTPLQRGVGVASQCPECRGEEFFLSSWANGDPALVLRWDAEGKKPVGARYKDDPSGVHHSYLGDAVRFRNLHAGPKETHVFHLHAHQWVLDASDPDSTYLDSQTIAPGATFSYGIEFGGSGNRNFTPGDSIFHCHLYPHFAQGMWELWRVHDVFEDGNDQGLFDPTRPAGPGNNPRWRRLPDAEVAGGTESPAVVPIPGQPLAPLPSASFAGYPFYIPGQAGHRPPQPPLDMDVVAAGYDPASGTEPAAADVVSGGLPRHVVLGGTLKTARTDPAVRQHALSTGGEAAQLIAQRVARQDPIALNAFAAVWDEIEIRTLPHAGTPQEQTAMRFHEGALAGDGLTPRAAPGNHPAWWPQGKGYATEFAATVGGQQPRAEGEAVFLVNGRPPAAGAPYANPCPVNAPRRRYRGAFIQTELTYNRHGWFDPQGRIVILENDIKDIIDASTRVRLPEPLFFRANSGDCIDFKSSNFVPSALNADDFQVFTPTDTIGQHIHLVKFDVTSSDGSGNGWNYEDGTFSPDEVRERIFAHNRRVAATGRGQRLAPMPHPLFRPGGDIHTAGSQGGADPQGHRRLLQQGACPAQRAGETDAHYEHRLHAEHPFCGAQRTTQLWWADPIINHKGKDNTLRTVFSHDHFGPSSHQQHGLYAGLVIEPANSVWTRVDAQVSDADMAQAGAAMASAAGGLGCDSGAPHRSPLCDKLIGGANLALQVPAARQRAHDAVLGVIEPRDALVLRADGGPASTLANIIAPQCVGDSDSSPLQPATGRRAGAAPTATCAPSDQTRREFALAIADFGIAYNAALEPINPEPRGPESGMRDHSAVRFGYRHVAAQPARPLGIASEDPGTQLVNYRHEPLALRIAEVSPVGPVGTPGDPEAALGGFSYRQSQQRASAASPCAPGDQDCLGDMANAFSTEVHAGRDKRLASEPQRAEVSSTTRTLLRSLGQEARLDSVLGIIEQWRRDFNCALYRAELTQGAGVPCRPGIARQEPWREFGDPATPVLPAFEGESVQVRLIQGAQEAQHVFTMNGVKWHRMPSARGSGYTNAQPVGISEHFEFDLVVNPLDNWHTDYLYAGSSVDQLWDGMWGVLRAYGRHAGDGQAAPQDGTRVAGTHGLALLPGAREVPSVTRAGANMVCTASQGAYQARRQFDVSVVRACDLMDDCAGQPKGIVYSESKRLNIRDPQAIVYVLNSERLANAGGAWSFTARTNTDVLAELRAQFNPASPADQRRVLEPLVLRAAAGECVEVGVRNHLPATRPSGSPGGDRLREVDASHNRLPMIADGFNMNQFSMSSSVGLSMPRLAQHPLYADGGNVGLNGWVRTLSEGGRAARQQGSLVPPCLDGAPNAQRCKGSSMWWAGDFEQSRRPLELGALPIRSFGDVIKHPSHGLIGAMVIGPAGSRVCADNRFARDAAGRALRHPTRLSAEICDSQERKLHVDHVLVFQDSVNALHGDLPVHNLSGAEEPDDYGMKALNYRTDPLWGRRFQDPSVPAGERAEADYSEVLSSALVNGRCASGVAPVMAWKHPCDPEVPVLESRPRETVRLHLVHPGGHTRQYGIEVAGHAFNPYPWSADSERLDAGSGSSLREGVLNGFGPHMGTTLQLRAGGTQGVPLDYLIRSQASFAFDGGIWAILRVRPGTSGAAQGGKS